MELVIVACAAATCAHKLETFVNNVSARNRAGGGGGGGNRVYCGNARNRPPNDAMR